jgi:hypothetical protein
MNPVFLVLPVKQDLDTVAKLKLFVNIKTKPVA